MTMRMVSHAAYTCDWCGAKQDGWLHELPEGWEARDGNLTTHHYCPAHAEFMNDEPPTPYIHANEREKSCER